MFPVSRQRAGGFPGPQQVRTGGCLVEQRVVQHFVRYLLPDNPRGMSSWSSRDDRAAGARGILRAAVTGPIPNAAPRRRRLRCGPSNHGTSFPSTALLPTKRLGCGGASSAGPCTRPALLAVSADIA